MHIQVYIVKSSPQKLDVRENQVSKGHEKSAYSHIL